MLKRIAHNAVVAATFAFVFVMSAAVAVTITGRESSFGRSVLQSGIAAQTPELAITASTTQTLPGAYQLTAGVSQITTANSNDAVKLPSLTALGSPSNLDASLNLIVINNTANSIQVFPFASTDVIVSNGAAGGAGAALTLTTLKSLDCWSVSSGRWYCMQG